jgi:hypothetical protein
MTYPLVSHRATRVCHPENADGAIGGDEDAISRATMADQQLHGRNPHLSFHVFTPIISHRLVPQCLT